MELSRAKWDAALAVSRDGLIRAESLRQEARALKTRALFVAPWLGDHGAPDEGAAGTRAGTEPPP